MCPVEDSVPPGQGFFLQMSVICVYSVTRVCIEGFQNNLCLPGGEDVLNTSLKVTTCTYKCPITLACMGRIQMTWHVCLLG